MGLDQYCRYQVGEPEQPVDFDADASQDNLLFYWRKHPNLHGWMQRLYAAKGGNPDPREFNVNARVLLTLQDLVDLEEAVSRGRLPRTKGFFFGASYASDRERDLDFIKIATAAIIIDNLSIYYTSWW